MPSREEETFIFGPFHLHASEGRLTREGKALPLTPKEFDTLLVLVQAEGRVVKKEELLARVWPDSYVGENSLTRNISVLRKALGEGVIETLPRRGYRLATPVSKAAAIPAPNGIKDEQPQAAAAGGRSQRRTALAWTAIGICVSLIVLSAMAWRHRASPKAAVHSVGVMVSVTPEQDEQAAILTEWAGESVTRSLRRAPGLRVLAEQSLIPEANAGDAARALGCEMVLLIEGERSGDRFRVHLRAVNSADGRQLWDETVTGRTTDAEWINANLMDVMARRFEGVKQTEEQKAASAEAFQDYLRGRYFWKKRGPENLAQAFAAFQAAIEKDPNFALAYAGLAQAYAVADLHDLRYRGQAITYEQARQAVEKALALDPQLAAAHAARAQILRNYDRDMKGAEREYRKAIKLDPDDATAHQWYAEFLTINGRHEEAIAEIDRAHQLDPLSVVITGVCGYVRLYARRYEESLPYSYEALKLDPHYYGIHQNIAGALEGLGRYHEAIDALEKEAEIAGDVKGVAAARADDEAYRRGGVKELWRERLRRALADRNAPDHDYVMAGLYCRVGDTAKCLSSLEQSLNERSEAVTGIKIDPSFDVIRNDPRYEELVAKFGFAEETMAGVVK